MLEQARPMESMLLQAPRSPTTAMLSDTPFTMHATLLWVGGEWVGGEWVGGEWVGGEWVRGEKVRGGWVRGKR